MLLLVEGISLALVASFILLLLRVLFCCWISPFLVHKKLKRNGFGGPTPSFPLGNISEMKRNNLITPIFESSQLTHNIHSIVFPYFSRWQTAHGKPSPYHYIYRVTLLCSLRLDVVFVYKLIMLNSNNCISMHFFFSIYPNLVIIFECDTGKIFTYWLGTEPFLYIADPEFLKILSTEVKAKFWGKPSVFKRDRKSMFGNGLVMAEGDEWVRQRHVITPAFNPSNLKVSF